MSKRLTIGLVLLLTTLIPLIGCSDDSESHAFQGIKLLDQGHYNEAINEFTQAIALDPNCVNYL